MFDPLTSSPFPLAISPVISAGSLSATVESVFNGLDIDDKFREYFDFEDYWHNNHELRGVHGRHERACILAQRTCRLLNHKVLGGAHGSPLAPNKASNLARRIEDECTG